MTTTVSGRSSDLADIEFALPNPENAARAILASAIEFCAQKMRLGSPEGAIELLRRGDRSAHDYLRYGLAAQVGEHLGALDAEVKAAYLYDDEATAEDMAFGEAAPSLIHMIVHARRKTGALDSLIVGLSRAIARHYGEVFDKPELRHLLDIQVTDDAEVEARTGLGALLNSLYHRPSPVWRR